MVESIPQFGITQIQRTRDHKENLDVPNVCSRSLFLIYIDQNVVNNVDKTLLIISL